MFVKQSLGARIVTALWEDVSGWMVHGIAAGLKLPLHAYQRHALAWMSWREHIGGSTSQEPTCVPSSSLQDRIDAEAAAMFGVGEGAVHPCWQPVQLPSGLHVFENRYTGT